MGVKISTIELKDFEIVELEDGSFERRFINPKKYPAFLTNRALSKGKGLGITKTSLISELVRMKSLYSNKETLEMENITEDQAEILDAERYLPVIYLGIIGANKNIELSYDDFLDQYQGDVTQVLNDYVALVEPYIQQNSNEFKKGLEQSTKKKSIKAKRK